MAFALYSSAFISEIMRSAYQGVEKGQREAALSVGMKNSQMFIRILLPQAFKIAIPNICNFSPSLFKGTSLLFSIGIVDIMGKTKMLSAANYGVYQLQCFIAAAIIYLIISSILDKLFTYFEIKYSRGNSNISNQVV